MVTGREPLFQVRDTSRPLLAPHASHGGVYEAPHWTAEEAQVQGKEMLRTRVTNPGTSPRADAETQALSLMPVTRLTTQNQAVQGAPEGTGRRVRGWGRGAFEYLEGRLGQGEGFIPEPRSSSGTHKRNCLQGNPHR